MMQNSALETSLDGLIGIFVTMRHYWITLFNRKWHNKWRRVLLAFIVVQISNFGKGSSSFNEI